MTHPDSPLLEKAITNIGDIVHRAIEHQEPEKALVVYDTEDELTMLLTEAYRCVMPHAHYVDFNAHTKEEIIRLFDALSPRDLVVLIQTSDFRLDDFRIRIQLFQRKLKVIDHRHLYRSSPGEMREIYVDSLAYDPSWYRGVGMRLKERLHGTQELRILGPGTELVVTGGLESPKPNLGDYTGMENIGGTFPIGEVFTEAIDVHRVNGTFMIYAFADTTFNLQMHEPFRVTIKDGLVESWDEYAPHAFPEVIALIQTNERALMREIGFGLNRAITRTRYLSDITAFERIHGLHFSLGEKHTVYKKQGITTDKTRFHVDVFPVVTQVFADGESIFVNDEYMV